MKTVAAVVGLCSMLIVAPGCARQRYTMTVTETSPTLPLPRAPRPAAESTRTEAPRPARPVRPAPSIVRPRTPESVPNQEVPVGTSGSDASEGAQEVLGTSETGAQQPRSDEPSTPAPPSANSRYDPLDRAEEFPLVRILGITALAAGLVAWLWARSLRAFRT